MEEGKKKRKASRREEEAAEDEDEDVEVLCVGKEGALVDNLMSRLLQDHDFFFKPKIFIIAQYL
jgi:hypothetical protein